DALAIAALAAPAPMTMPYQLPLCPACISNVTGLAGVPATFRDPLTVSSIRLGSLPEDWASPVRNCTTVPAWMVRVAPACTVMSPLKTDGLPAGVQVWFPRLPPEMIVAEAARGATAAAKRTRAATEK